MAGYTGFCIFVARELGEVDGRTWSRGVICGDGDRASVDAGRLPDYTRLTEQRIGVAFLPAREAEEPGAIAREDRLLHYRSATRAEIDFTAGWLNGVPYEGKYTEGPWLRKTQTATAAYGRCVLATRNVTERVSDEKRQLLAIPAPLLALLIDPRPDTEAHSI